MPAAVALEQWLTRYASLIAAKRGLKEAVPSIFEAGADAHAYSRDRLTAPGGQVLGAGADSGGLRSAFEPQGVGLAGAAATKTFPEGMAQGKRSPPSTRPGVGGL